MHIDSNQHKGTRIESRSPASDARPQPTADQTIVHGQGEFVLLVDDEKMLVDLGIEQLKRLGYQVTGVVDPKQAITLVQNDPHKWAVVLSDYTMPAMSGTELARALHAIRADLPIILSSGYGALIQESQLKELNVVAILDKPVEVRVLAEALQQHIKYSSDH